jgi:hypothetical protein
MQFSLQHGQQITLMFSACVNPECRINFAYHEGRFFRFHKSHLPEEAPPNTHSVQDFAGVGNAPGNSRIEYVEREGLVMLHQLEMPGEFASSPSIAAA